MDMISYSGVFTKDEELDKKQLFEELTDQEPVIGIIIDGNERINERKCIGKKTSKAMPSDDVVYKMYHAKEGEYKADKYIFTKRIIGQGQTLIVAVSLEIGISDKLKFLSNIIWAMKMRCGSL